jgi:mono/diheme cytochrome c family protein
MSSRRELAIWVAAAFGATTLLTGAVIWQQRSDQTHWSIFMVGTPHEGAQLFFGRAACSHCHSVNGVGGDTAPDLGFSDKPEGGLNQIASAMWNHAPRMWERMRTEKISYPDLRNEDMAHLFAFLYVARYVDERGDTENGGRLFVKKGCGHCHTFGAEGGGIGPDLSSAEGIDTPIRWTMAMWNHLPAMEKRVAEMHLPWPRFEGREMNDLLAYIRSRSNGQRHETELLPANPDRGRKIFQSKSCIECHAVQGKGGRAGPDLGGSQRPPLTIVQFAGLMWNHSPDTWCTVGGRSIPRPSFEAQEIADLIAYFASLRYFEPAGSSPAGQLLFSERGCDHCHGSSAEGTHEGPALRSRGAAVTTISLAASLWQHGPKMYQRTRKLGRSWPPLNEDDIGDVVAFLNTPPENRKGQP